MTSFVAADSAIISASVELVATSVWSLLVQVSGTPANWIKNPVLDLAVLGSVMA